MADWWASGRVDEVNIPVAVTAETGDLTTGDGKFVFRLPYAMQILEVRASVTTAPVGSTIVVDVEKNGTTIFSTLLTIDAAEKTSVTAAVPAVISDSRCVSDDEIKVNIDQVGSGTAGVGLKLLIRGVRL